MGNKSIQILGGLFLGIAWPGAAGPAQPVGMVTDIAGPAALDKEGGRAVDIGDDLFAGQNIRLPKGAAITLIYFQGCTQEVIPGEAVVKIGERQSALPESGVKRSTTVCEFALGELPEGASSVIAGVRLKGGDTIVNEEGKEQKDRIEEEIRSAPEGVSPRLRYAVNCLARGRYDEAVRQYETLVRLRPESRALAAGLYAVKAASEAVRIEGALSEAGKDQVREALQRAGSASVLSDKDAAELIDRRSARLKDVLRLFSAGLGGEGNDGLLKTPPGNEPGPKDKLLINRENRDRQAFFRFLVARYAKEHLYNADLISAKFRKEFAALRQRAARQGDLYETPAGEWRRK